ncbi:hypothetical protein GSI_14174 [Ganoderma sinense ZZ0214-1]|uniref:Uncharacterized protein n=1 Tax=Ganoderma sinense ZZ0214-1 TaxID=1077348 RepID=A0A2G8RSD2_9APHY|nr:hypothetical protein GSI_14174 [Ganoderma sinense ZZ0214-1]
MILTRIPFSHSNSRGFPLINLETISRTSVSEVRSILSSLNIPMELVLHIMAIAEYCPTLRTQRPDTVKIAAGLYHNTEACWAAKLYLVSPPLPRAPEDTLFWRVRKVTWELEGRDQGRSNQRRGEYRGACSWYDACIFRPLQAQAAEGIQNFADLTEIDGIDRTFTDPRRGMFAVQELLGAAGWTMVPHGDSNELTWRLQNNRIADSRYKRHVFEWSVDRRGVAADAKHRGSCDGEGFVEALRPGDRIGIWMRAQYRGWKCHTKMASVSVMYEFR